MNVLGKGLWAVPPGIPPFGPCLCGWLKGGAWRWYSWLILPKELYNVKYVCKAGVHWILAAPVGDCLFSRKQPPTHTNFLSQTLGKIHYVYSWAEKRMEASQGQEHREAWALGSSLRVHKRWWQETSPMENLEVVSLDCYPWKLMITCETLLSE